MSVAKECCCPRRRIYLPFSLRLMIFRFLGRGLTMKLGRFGLAVAVPLLCAATIIAAPNSQQMLHDCLRPAIRPTR